MSRFISRFLVALVISCCLAVIAQAMSVPGGLNSSLLSGSIYKAKGITLDGTNNTYARGAAFTGIADGTGGTVSFWYTLEGGNASQLILLTSQGNRTNVYRDSSNRWHISSSSGATLLDVNTTTTYTASAGTWHHLMANWSLTATPTFNLYIDGAAPSQSVNNLTAGTQDYSRTNWWVGSDSGVGSWFNGSVFDFYFSTTSIDLSVAANRALFYSSAGKPVNLGSTGQTPTGSSPILFQHVGSNGVAADFATNLGTGGGMTAAGTTIALSATSPTD